MEETRPNVESRLVSASDEIKAAYAYLKAGKFGDRSELEQALLVYLAWLVPQHCEGIVGDHWLTEPGQVLSKALWAQNKDQALTLAEAGRRMGWGGDSRGMVRIRDSLPLWHYPNKRTHGGYYVLNSDVQKLKERSK